MRTSAASGAAILAVLALASWLVAFRGDWLKRAHHDEDEKVEPLVPVHVAKSTRTTLHRFVDGYGVVAPEPAHDGAPAAGAHLASPVAGVLASASCAEGDHVEKGAVLFQLDVRAAAAEEQKAAAARTSSRATLVRLGALADHAQRELERTKRLNQDDLASERDLREAELRVLNAKNELGEAGAKAAEAERALAAAQTQRGLYSIRSPLAATVTHVRVNPGEAVEMATVLAELIDLDRLVVTATIPAAELSWLRIGQPVEMRVAERARDRDAGEDEGAAIQQGKLVFVGFEVDAKTDTVPVRVSIPKDASLRPGQYVRVRVAVEEHASCIAVPLESVVAGPDGGKVISVVEGDKALLRSVQAGLREGALIEIRGEGLSEGMTVVTSGAYGLPKETRVRVIGE